MEKLLDKEVHQSFKAPSLVDLLGSRSPCSQPAVPLAPPATTTTNPVSPYHQMPSGSSASPRIDHPPRHEEPLARHPNPPVAGVGARPKITYPRRCNRY